MAGLTVATKLGSSIGALLGQTLGWRETYLSIVALGGSSLFFLRAFLLRTFALDGAAVQHELHGLGRPRV